MSLHLIPDRHIASSGKYAWIGDLKAIFPPARWPLVSCRAVSHGTYVFDLSKFETSTRGSLFMWDVNYWEDPDECDDVCEIAIYTDDDECESVWITNGLLCILSEDDAQVLSKFSGLPEWEDSGTWVTVPNSVPKVSPNRLIWGSMLITKVDSE